MNYKLAILAVAALAACFATYAYAATSTASVAKSSITDFSAFDSWLAVIIIAIILSFSLAGAQYLIGVMLSNQGVRARALSEFGQAFGSVALVVIVLIVINFFGTTLTAANLIGPGKIAPICNTLQGSGIDFLNSNPSNGGLIKGPSPTAVICDNIIMGKSTHTVTRGIDYGLGAIYVIDANMTNQTLRDFSEIYSWDNFLLFLRQAKEYESLCFPEWCADPIAPPSASIKVSYDYFAGYVLHRGITPIMAGENTLGFYVFFVQLIVILMFLLVWPYMLAAGLILRSVNFTRRLGGFLIALTIVILLVYPFLNLMEYSALSNMQKLDPAGASSMPNLALCARASQTVVPYCAAGSGCAAPKQIDTSGLDGVYCYTTADKLPASYIFKGIPPDNMKNSDMVSACPSGSSVKQSQDCYVRKDINLYVLPDIKDVTRLYSWWPGGGNILEGETEFYLWALAPGNSGPVSLSSVISLFSNGFTNLDSFPECFSIYGVPLHLCMGPKHLATTLSALFNLYALFALSAFVIPIINTLLVLSATLGLSSLLGGETTLLGLTRFV
ncbi:MAG: hypothetical protein KGH69_00795 [Candidatus Micrarchaeota archaeon]|nr:hypothetical protein [Candidatus Micrarchaeota archaeon]